MSPGEAVSRRRLRRRLSRDRIVQAALASCQAPGFVEGRKAGLRIVVDRMDGGGQAARGTVRVLARGPVCGTGESAPSTTGVSGARPWG